MPTTDPPNIQESNTPSGPDPPDQPPTHSPVLLVINDVLDQLLTLKTRIVHIEEAFHTFKNRDHFLSHKRIAETLDAYDIRLLLLDLAIAAIAPDVASRYNLGNCNNEPKTHLHTLHNHQPGNGPNVTPPLSEPDPSKEPKS